jgi:hypothetical protein
LVIFTSIDIVITAASVALCQTSHRKYHADHHCGDKQSKQGFLHNVISFSSSLNVPFFANLLENYRLSFSRCCSKFVESTYDIGNCWAKAVLMFVYEPIRLIDVRAETVSPSNSSILENRLLDLRFVYALIQTVIFTGL